MTDLGWIVLVFGIMLVGISTALCSEPIDSPPAEVARVDPRLKQCEWRLVLIESVQDTWKRDGNNKSWAARAALIMLEEILEGKHDRQKDNR